jgi:hypothetical protein
MIIITGWLQNETAERCQRNPHQRVGAWKLTRHTIQQIPQVLHFVPMNHE